MTTDLAATAPATNLSAAASTTHVLPSPFTYTQPPPTLLTQGAEALVYKTHFLDESTPAILKFRPSKAYRHPTLDARLTKQRVLAEARVLVKLSGLGAESEVSVPAVLGLEWDVGRKVKGAEGAVRVRRGEDVSRLRMGEEQAPGQKGAWILMEYIEGGSVKELLRGVDSYVKGGGDTLAVEEKQGIEEDVKSLLRRIGRAVGAMHSRGGVVHGDLTSSNIMVRPRKQDTMNGHAEEQQRSDSPDLNGEIVLIDFGLATQSIQDEDRAVDLYVLERAFGSTHPRQERWFDAEVLQHQDGYKGSFKDANVVLKRLEEVRMRGRKRSMIG
ncbi:serine/threonine-protein kinase bud32 [Knufia fluminis]|uniref:EKC/KEOPS complex subunit BUD32 n=2 Tax=Knufia TaxID=430999 RepID=A0AAN8EY81_9EURO|nr:serine/threonine-protein kinase bud32 [Knufia fluminis]